MGKTKLGRMFRDMVIRGVRAGAEVVNTIPGTGKYCGSRRIVQWIIPELNRPTRLAIII